MRKKGILILPIILMFYMVVGTLECRLERKINEPIVQAFEYDYSAEIDNVKAIHNEIFEQIEIMNEDLRLFENDEGIPLSFELQIHIKNECNKYGVDVSEAVAIMLTENPTLEPELINKNTNGTIDTGLFQVNSCRNDELKSMGINNLKDPKQNITAGVFIISTLDKYSGHEKYMAYNMGVGGMKKAVSRGVSSTNYSRKVLSKIREGY